MIRILLTSRFLRTRTLACGYAGASALDGGPQPDELVSQPVAPVSEQRTFFLDDFFKAPIRGH